MAAMEAPPQISIQERAHCKECCAADKFPAAATTGFTQRSYSGQCSPGAAHREAPPAAQVEYWGLAFYPVGDVQRGALGPDALISL